MKPLLSMVILILLTSCQRHNTNSKIKLSFTTDSFDIVSKALSNDEEKKINDLNIYAFCEATGIAEYIYCNSMVSELYIQLPDGVYDFYVIANMNKELGEKNKIEVTTMLHNISSEQLLEKNKTLLMTGYTQTIINSSATIPIILKRVTAKIEVSCSIDPSIASDIRLQSIMIANVPSLCPLFSNNTKADQKINYSERNITGNNFSGSFYMLENLAGVNSAITTTDKREKNNAPKNASYLYISALYKQKQVYYSIYLGENQTSDFNIRRNKRYLYNISIQGANPTDVRISLFEFSLAPTEVKHVAGEILRSVFNFKSANIDAEKVTVRCLVLRGKGTVLMDGIYQSLNEPVQFLPKGKDNINIPLSFYPYPDYIGTVDIMVDVFYEQRSLSKLITTEYKSRGDILVNSTPFSDPYAYCESSFSLNFTQKGYSGTFTVKLEPENTLYGSYYGNNTLIGVQGSTFTNLSEPLSMRYNAGHAIGETRMKATVTNSFGESAQYLISTTINKMIINITPTITYGIVSNVVSDGIQQDSYIDLRYSLDRKAMYDLYISQGITYNMVHNRYDLTVDRETGRSITILKDRTTFSYRMLYDDELTPLVIINNGVEQIKRSGYKIGNKLAFSITAFNPATNNSLIIYQFKEPIFIRRDR